MTGDDDSIHHVEIVQSPDVLEALMHKRLVKAGGLTQDDVGKFIGCHDGSVDYPAKIERLQRFENGSAPGVTVWTLHPPLNGRAAREERSHVQFDYTFELIELIAM